MPGMPLRATRAFVAFSLALAFAPFAGAGQHAKQVEWGVYAQLAGTTWTAPGGWPRKAWRWSADGKSLIELEQRDARSAPTLTTIEAAKNGDKLVAQGPDGKRKGTIGKDGAVAWSAEGKGEDGSRVVVREGALVEQVVERSKKKANRVVGESVSAPSKDTAWVDAALAPSASGKDKGKGKGAKQDAPQNLAQAIDPKRNTPSPNTRTAPVAPPAAAVAAPAAAATAGAVTQLEVNGQRWPVTRTFPANILGTYLYEKRGDPIIELRGDGTGRFQAHMIAPIQIRWWLKATPSGAPDKVTAANGNHRYTVVLQYVNSNNANYPSDGYDTWYLDTDVATGCSIILGERYRCR